MSDLNPLYLSLGTTILGLSFLTMSMIFGDEEVRQYINTQINLAKMHAIFLVLITLYMYIIGIIHSILKSYVSREFIIAGVGIIWIGFLAIEFSSIINLYRAGFRPRASKTLLDIGVYFAVFWFIMERINVKWMVIQIFTTIFMVCTIYFIFMLGKYRKMITILAEPMDLYLPAIGLRMITAIAGLTLISYGHSEGAFKGLIALAYLILAIIFWRSALEMERVFGIGKSM